MNAQFKRSKRFALVGLPILVVFVVVIALTLGDGANPTGALVLILAAVFGFLAIVLTLQRRDAALATAAGTRALPQSAPTITDPTTVDPDTLLVALATGPIDHEAIVEGRRNAWSMATDSIGAGGRMTALIFVAVVPWILFQFIWSLVVLVPVIVAYAGYLSMRALGPGGQLDQGLEAGEATVKPLGLRMTERPQVRVQQRVGVPGVQGSVEGSVVYEGRRHGRAVTVRFEGLGSVVSLAAPGAAFAIEAKGERLRAGPDAPPEVETALGPLRASSYWRGVRVDAGPELITVVRSRGGAEHWLRDLWLAERLAEVTAR